MLSLIIPVYKNEENIPPLLDAIKSISKQIDDDFEAVFVVDGSPDGSFIALRDKLPTAGFPAQLIALSRNFGAFAAIRAGLERANGNTFAVMAADLQEPPELIVNIHAALKADTCDVAYGERTKRCDPWISRLLSHIFWSFYRRNVTLDIPRGGVDIFGCNRVVRDQVLRLEEQNSSLVVLLFWIGFRRQVFTYQRRTREIGSSAWTFSKKWKYMQDSIFSFSDLPISFLLAVGFFGIFLSIIFAIVVFLGSVLGHIEVPGYAATIIVILFFGALQLLSTGVLGIYIWRVFDNTKGRPLHIVMSAEKYLGTEQSVRTKTQ